MHLMQRRGHQQTHHPTPLSGDIHLYLAPVLTTAHVAEVRSAPVSPAAGSGGLADGQGEAPAATLRTGRGVGPGDDSGRSIARPDPASGDSQCRRVMLDQRHQPARPRTPTHRAGSMDVDG